MTIEEHFGQGCVRALFDISLSTQQFVGRTRALCWAILLLYYHDYHISACEHRVSVWIGELPSF